MTPGEAQALGDGIREEWMVLHSLLVEAQETEAWVAAGYDRVIDWLGGDLPPLALLLATEAPAAPPVSARQARVSRPGAGRDTSLARRDVTPFPKGGRY